MFFKDLGNTLPDCVVCGKKSCARMLVNSIMMCGDCVVKNQKMIETEQKKHQDETINKIRGYIE